MTKGKSTKFKESNLEKMNKIIRIMGDVKPVRYASKAAINECKKIRPDINIFDLKPKNAHALGQDEKGKSRLFCEHIIPVNQLIKSLLQCNNKEDVEEIIRQYPGICWVLREENNRLDKNKYRNHRPNGGLVEYRECGIEIIESPYYKK